MLTGLQGRIWHRSRVNPSLCSTEGGRCWACGHGKGKAPLQEKTVWDLSLLSCFYGNLDYTSCHDWVGSYTKTCELNSILTLSDFLPGLHIPSKSEQVLLFLWPLYFNYKRAWETWQLRVILVNSIASLPDLIHVISLSRCVANFRPGSSLIAQWTWNI